jgi:phage-related tail fiber protein
MAYSQVITDVGMAKIAAALAGGPKVLLTEIAVGDADTLPVSTLTALGHEVWRDSANVVEVDPADPNRVLVEAKIDVADGGWTMREAGAFDADGDLILIARIPDAIKPDPGTDGAGVAAYIRMAVECTDAGDALTLTVDDSVIMATRVYVDDRTVGSLLYAWQHFS